MGEPAGIGGEILIKAALAARARHLPTFFAIDDPERLRALADQMGARVSIEPIAAPGDVAGLPEGTLGVLPLENPVEAVPGRPSATTAPQVIRSIETAVALARRGAACGIITNPIQKSVLYEAGFEHPGHTEYLGHLLRPAQPPVMMLAIEGLKVVPVTVHLPLSAVAGSLRIESILLTAKTVLGALARDFAIPKPRLAVAALNPHAGEGGALGPEEGKIIQPAVAALRALGHDVRGPYPADTLFHAGARETYDAALCMYHDQALIPLKTLDFERGVNITLGLSIVRTSPDHGTALDIAGTGQASAESLIAAIETAASIARNRRAAP